MARNEPVVVFIVMIGTHRGMESKVGAAYWNEALAEKEVRRLNASHRETRAYFVTRELPFPTFLGDLDTPKSFRRREKIGWGQER